MRYVALEYLIIAFSFDIFYGERVYHIDIVLFCKLCNGRDVVIFDRTDDQIEVFIDQRVELRFDILMITAGVYGVDIEGHTGPFHTVGCQKESLIKLGIKR